MIFLLFFLCCGIGAAVGLLERRDPLAIALCAFSAGFNLAMFFARSI